MVGTLPGADVAGIKELLRRDRQILELLETVLTRLPARRGVVDFERDYRQLVGNRLDRVEFFGATLTESSRHYPLSVAYLSLAVSGDFPRSPVEELPGPIRRTLVPTQDPLRFTLVGAGTARVEDVLAAAQRIFVRGQAGIGKTTLLQWIAVQSAQGAFGGRTQQWNGTVPFFIPLRRYAQRDLPAPEEFLAEVGRHIAEEMPPGWVQRQLRSGAAIVLVDGVDELPEERRDDVRGWLRDLIASFPAARYVVTTRSAATPADWLGADDFTVAELEPMTASDVSIFVRRWHAAMREQCGDAEERDRLTEYEDRLLAAFSVHRHLRRLAGYPLLCALLCALHRDRHAELPANRMELYEVALHMLLDRRDRERRLTTGPDLSRTDKTLLLRDIAYWLIRNGWSSVAADRVEQRVTRKLRGMTHVRATAPQVYRALLERSGLLREPVEGQVDFVHRSFQEYLAAAEAAEASDDSGADDIGALVANAHTDAWSEVVVLAAGHASARHRIELLTGILDRIAAEPGQVADTLRLVALACLDTSPELPPELRARIEREAGRVIPPANMAAARAVAKSDFAVDLLVRSRPKSAASVAATIRAAAEIGDPAALPLLARFGTDRRKSVVRELLRAWPRFDPEEYARTVLPAYPLDDKWFRVDDARLAPALRHLTGLHSLLYEPAGVPLTDLGFVSDLPALEVLVTSRVADLPPIAGTNLQLLQCRKGLSDGEPLSVAPVADAPGLRRLYILRQPVANLQSLPALSELVLHELGSAGRLHELRHLTDLTRAGFGNLPDLVDLKPLGWLTAPEYLSVDRCGALTDLSGVSAWANSLRNLWLIGSGAFDPRGLAPLHRLEHLYLGEAACLDLTRMPELPTLSLVSLYGESRATSDLSPLRRLPALQDVFLWDVRAVDLTPLVGRGITVQVPIDAVVTGSAGFLREGGVLRRVEVRSVEGQADGEV